MQSYKKLKHKYQGKAERFLMKKPQSGLFLDMGLGKTAIVLAYFLSLRKKKKASKMLVIAPLRVIYDVWPDEIETWMEFNHLTYRILHGTKKNQYVKEDADIYLINPEGLKWFVEQPTYKADVLIIDESTKFKNWSSKRFKILKKILKNFQYRHILTGTPTTTSLIDLFSQMFILDLGKSLGKFITGFRARYFRQIPLPGHKAFIYNIFPGAAQEIYELIGDSVLRMDAEDYLDLPKKTVNNIFLTLDKKARKTYDAMQDDLIAELTKTQNIFALTVTDAIMKCRQIISGALYTNPKRGEYTRIHDIKINALKDLVDEMQGQQLLVVYEFKHELYRFREEFGDDIPYIGGGSKDASMYIEAWNMKRLPLLFVHPKSVGHGLNLQKGGNHLLWYSLTWSWDEYKQTIARIARQGQTKPVFIHRLIMRDTLDVYMSTKLNKKKQIETDLFDYLKQVR